MMAVTTSSCIGILWLDKCYRKATQCSTTRLMTTAVESRGPTTLAVAPAEKAKAVAKGLEAVAKVLEAVAKVAANVLIVASLGTKRVIAHSPVKRKVAMGRVAVARAKATKSAASSSKGIAAMETIAASAMNDRW